MKKIFFPNVLEWEKFQKKNLLTKYLHNVKYIHLKKKLEKLKLKKINILDLGCGFADIFKILNSSYDIQYTGIENNKEIFLETHQRYSNSNNFNILNQSVSKIDGLNKEQFDIIIMFDVLEHINLSSRIKLFEDIDKFKFYKLYINVPNEVGFAVLIKNLGSFIMKYDRYKEYNLFETYNSFLSKIENFPPHIDQHKGFDWKVLKYMLHYYFQIDDIRTILNNILPNAFSSSIFFECQKRNSNKE